MLKKLFNKKVSEAITASLPPQITFRRFVLPVIGGLKIALTDSNGGYHGSVTAEFASPEGLKRLAAQLVEVAEQQHRSFLEMQAKMEAAKNGSAGLSSLASQLPEHPLGG